MIPNVGRGRKMAGLMAYLVGPGKRNEHVDPHLVAGDGPVTTWWSETQLDHSAAMRIARHLDVPKRVFGADMRGAHVWHASLSLNAREGVRGDQEWQEIAHRFMQEMGFADEVKAPVRWVAVHHGQSVEGNDHIHIVADIVREDGTRLNVHDDAERAQRVCRRLEREFGLERVKGGPGAASGYKKGEREAEARRRARGRHEELHRQGRTEKSWVELDQEQRDTLVADQLQRETARRTLERNVRTLACAASNEAEFVRSMRSRNMLVRPRFAAGSTTEVVGYSVAEKPERGERPVWFGGSTLGRDLGLTTLRERWDGSPVQRAEAQAEWAAAWRQKKPHVKTAPGAPASAERGTGLWSEAAEELAGLRERLAATPLDNDAEWSRVAQETAAAFGAWSLRMERKPGPLAHAADSLSRAARFNPPSRVRPVSQPSLVAGMLLAATAGRGGLGGQIAVLHQLTRTARAIHDLHVADQDARTAERIETVMREEVGPLYRRLTQAQKHPTTKPSPDSPDATTPQRSQSRTSQKPPTARPHVRETWRDTRPVAEPLQARPRPVVTQLTQERGVE